MPLITMGQGTPDVEPGTYPVTVANVVAKTITGTVNEYNPTGADQDVFEWTFNVDTDDEEVIEINGLTSRMTGPSSKLAKWIEALLGAAALQPGATFDLPDLLGKSALAKVGLNKKGYSRVEDLMAKPVTGKVTRVKPISEQAAPAPEKTGDDADLPF